MNPDWLDVRRGEAPLVIGLPHTGTDVPEAFGDVFVSPWLTRKDTDWWVDRLYNFAHDLGATIVRTRISRSVIDVNRDPSGTSLYPGQATTGLCPISTFDGEPLYREGYEPDASEIRRRTGAYFQPYHAALRAELARLGHQHEKVVLYDAHSIRSHAPRLFEGELPVFNLGSNSGASCAGDLLAMTEAACDRNGWSRISNARFKGGWTTRHHGDPAAGVHALQMELACRGYMDEPREGFTPATWPSTYSDERAEPMRRILTDVLQACVAFAKS